MPRHPKTPPTLATIKSRVWYWLTQVVLETNKQTNKHTHTHTHTFDGPLSGTTRVSRYQKGKDNLDFTEARDSGISCTSLQTDNHASTPPLSFLQAGCPSYCPTNSIKALKAFKALEKKLLNRCSSNSRNYI